MTRNYLQEVKDFTAMLDETDAVAEVDKNNMQNCMTVEGMIERGELDECERWQTIRDMGVRFMKTYYPELYTGLYCDDVG